ncbi:MAG: DUF4476 domain-containing protein [Myxococcota bacterium]
MRTILAVLALQLALPAVAAPRRGPPPPRPAPVAAPVALPGDAELVSIQRSIAELEVIAQSIRNESVARSLRNQIAYLREASRGLDDARWGLADQAAAFEQEAMACASRQRRLREKLAQPPPPPVQQGPVPISQGELADILRAVEAQAFDAEKLAVLRSASRSRWFTSGQVRQIVSSFTFGKDQVEAAAMLHPAVVDPGNWFVVYDAFQFDSDRRRLRQRIGD